MTHDLSLGIVKFTNGTDEIAYKMPHKIEQFNSLSDLEKEHTKSVYFRNKEDKRRGVDYVMNKILGFYKECLELKPEYLTGLEEEEGVENRYMVTLVDGVLANGVVMIFEVDIAFYAIQGMEILSLMIRLRILSIILLISHAHLHNPNTCHTLVVSLAWETISEIERAFEDKQYQPEGILELFRKLHNDVQNIHEELAGYINTLNWKRPIVYYDDDDDEDYTIAITPVLTTKDPVDSLIMEDEHLETISATESDEVIKSSVENLV
ncbi:hypothetical protein Tco_0751992 [Tanacetum coccineum]|uniref:Uncharacterized protein n=1 Tax=Tanacetum coccineum TaxID=301880 RepID=A0ABQ4Z788_9ASTR